MHKTWVWALMVGWTAMVAPADAWAQPFEMVGSRALGMAGAFVAVSDDASGVYWNPAGLASGQPAGVSGEWVRFRSGDRDASLVGGPWQRSARFVSLGTWPIGVSYTQIDEVVLGAGAAVDRFETRHYGLAMLQTITEGLVVGTTLKYVRGTVATGISSVATVGEALEAGADLDGRTTGAFDLDVSAMYDARVFRLGATIKNVRSPEFSGNSGQNRALARKSRVGLAILPSAGLTLAIDLDLDTADVPTGSQRMLAAGAEYQVSPKVALRAGARRNLEGTKTTVGAAGASLALRPGTWLDGHVTMGRSHGERGLGLALRAGW